MKAVTSKIKLNVPKIKQLDRASTIVLEKTMSALHTEVIEAQVMPFDTGDMQNNSTFEDYSKSSKGQASLITTSPQARRLYYHPEYNFQTKENPNAQGNWYDSWINGKNKNFCKNAYAQFYKREAGL